MASNSLQSLHHHHSLLKLLPSDTSPPFSLFLKPTTSASTATNTSLSLSISSTASTSTAYSISPATSTTPSTSKTFSLDLLQQHLSNQNFRQADEETRRLLIVLAGEAAQKRGSYQNKTFETLMDSGESTATTNLDTAFNGEYGDKRLAKTSPNFSSKLGWMKKLDTEVEQHNYRSFPSEFIWELDDDTPEGHLPLTNALRGTQLLSTILSHPAFEVEEEAEEDEVGGDEKGGLKGLRDSSNPSPLSNRVFKTDYSF
ncbi:hypothetical protein OIU76_025277 [Salix suchowensis]|nr:hypothetical protein OIU76_025277 [Salix suchowensis]